MIFFRWAFANDKDGRGKCWTGSPPDIRSNLLGKVWGTWLGKCVLCTLAGSAHTEADKILPPGQIFTFSWSRLVPNCGWIETYHHFALWLLELAMRLLIMRFHAHKRLFYICAFSSRSAWFLCSFMRTSAYTWQICIVYSDQYIDRIYADNRIHGDVRTTLCVFSKRFHAVKRLSMLIIA